MAPQQWRYCGFTVTDGDDRRTSTLICVTDWHSC